MAGDIPSTSETLLAQLSEDAQHARWGEFVNRYSPMLRAYLVQHFPSLEPDDLLQDTFLALVKALPTYRYNPDSGRFFHNYLTGILRNKALRTLRGMHPTRALDEVEELASPTLPTETLEAVERDALREIALNEFLDDPAVHEQTKQIFLRVAVNGEAVSSVAAAVGLVPNAVYQVKHKALARLRETIRRLEAL